MADYSSNMWDLSRFTTLFWIEWYSLTNRGSLTYVAIPELKDATLAQVKCVNKEYFVAIYKRNVAVSLAIHFWIFLISICVKDEIYLYSKAGVQLTRLALDFVGIASIANREKQSLFFLTFSGFNTAGTITYYDFAAAETRLSIPSDDKLKWTESR